MVLISNGGTINIRNHHKMKCNEKKNENFNISIINNNKTLENTDDGPPTYILYEEVDYGKGKKTAAPVTKNKKK